jgi:hypothetical protein
MYCQHCGEQYETQEETLRLCGVERRLSMLEIRVERLETLMMKKAKKPAKKRRR